MIKSYCCIQISPSKHVRLYGLLSVKSFAPYARAHCVVIRREYHGVVSCLLTLVYLWTLYVMLGAGNLLPVSRIKMQ